MAQYLRSLISWKTLLISILFGLASLFTISSGVHFYLPGTSALSDPREIFNSLGAAITGPVGGIVIAITSTITGQASNLKLFSIIQHLMSALWIGWGYKKLVYDRYGMPYLVFGWLFLIFVYSYITYLPGIIILHFMFNSLFQEFVGGPLTAWEGIIKLYSGWLPETIFTALYTTLVLIALPPKYRKPLWGKEKPGRDFTTRSPLIFIPKLFSKNFVAIRLSIWFILLFSIPLVYLSIFNRNYFLDYFLKNETVVQFEAAHHVADLLDKTPTADFKNIVDKINNTGERTLWVLDSRLNNFFANDGRADGKFNFPLLSEEQKKFILENRSGTFVDTKEMTGVGFAFIKNKNLYVFSISPVGKYESDLNHLIILIYKNLGIILLLISILSGGILWLVIGKPIKKLTVVAEEIGRHNYDVSLDASDLTDEIKSLAHAVNEMKSSIKAAEEGTNEKELKFRLLFETANDAIFLLKDDRFIDCNSKTLELFDWSKDEIIGHSVIEFSPEYQSDGVPSKVKADEKLGAALDDIPQFFEWTHFKRDGTLFEVEVSLNKIHLKDGFYIQTILRDITERKRTYTELQLSEAKFKSLINSMQDLVYTLDKEMKIVGLYGMWSEMYGLSEELLLGKKLTTFLSPAQAEINDVANERALNGESVKYEWSLNQNGDKFYFESSLTPLFGPEGETVGIVGVAREITERKKTETRIIESEERYRKLFEGSPDPIIVHKNGNILFANSASVELLGAQEKEQIIGRNIFDFVHPEFHALKRERLDKLSKGDEKLELAQEKFVKIDGSIIDVEVSTISFLHEGEIAAQVVVRDITERKNTERMLVKSEGKFRSIFESASVSILILGMDQKIVQANRAFLNMLGLTEEEVLGKSILDFTFEEDRTDTKSRVANMSSSGMLETHVEKRYYHKSGKLIWGIASGMVVKDEVGKPLYIVGIIQDITERVEANKNIRKLSQAVEQSPVSIVITDTCGTIEYVNPKFTEVTGYTFDEAIGQNPRILKSGTQPGEFYKNLWKTITSGNDWRGEFRNIKKSGDLYWELASISPIKNSSGNITNFIAIKEDITEQRKNREELVKSKYIAEEANKLKSSLLENMSHEFRTPLNGILGFSQLLRDELADKEQLDMIEKIMQSGKRLLNTLNSVLTLTELENNNYLLRKSEVDLTFCCKELRSIYIKHALNKNLELKLDLPYESVNILTDENILKKIISSIIENAIKYTHSGEIIIQLTTLTEENGQKYAAVNVSDTGIGIKAEDQSIIFEEFKQLSEGLRRDFEGLGLGLSLANKMIGLIGGRISVQSELGKGSKFTLLLPDVIPSESTSLQPKEPENGEEISITPDTKNLKTLPHVLLIEDNPLNIEVVQKFLAKTCIVSSTRDGITAIEMCRNNSYSLLMIDINLGHGIDGTEALTEIKKIAEYEKIPVIALTGYASETSKKEFLEQGFTHYLAKPFEKGILIKLINNILGLG